MEIPFRDFNYRYSLYSSYDPSNLALDLDFFIQLSRISKAGKFRTLSPELARHLAAYSPDKRHQSQAALKAKDVGC